MRLRFIAAGLGMFVVGGCAAPELYYWGTYEASVLRTAADDAGIDPSLEIAALEQTVDRADRRGQILPPGFRAHLGWMYWRAGDGARARVLFEEEMELWPQSTVLMTRLITGLAIDPEAVGS